MISPPCDKNCPKRSATCHASCKDYIDWSDERKKMLDAQYKDRMTQVALNEIKFGKGKN